jgi:hypothetical protein
MSYKIGDDVIVLEGDEVRCAQVISVEDSGRYHILLEDGNDYYVDEQDLVDNTPDADVNQKQIHILFLRLQYWKAAAEHASRYNGKLVKMINNKIGWEQRRWELASMIFASDTHEYSIRKKIEMLLDRIDFFICVYKDYEHIGK